ncbi:unnamed protein product, partial [Phaeothamnion confervicola]
GGAAAAAVGSAAAAAAGNSATGSAVGASSGWAAAASAASTAPAAAVLSTEAPPSRTEALGYFRAAEEAFRRCDAQYLKAVDNYAYLCLDTVWLLFLTRDMKRLPLAERLLAAAKDGFRRSHGAGLERLMALKGEHCAERALYVRLHLLDGVVAFLQGRSGDASALLIRAQHECRALSVRPELVRQLMQESAIVWRMPIDHKLATRTEKRG